MPEQTTLCKFSLTLYLITHNSVSLTQKREKITGPLFLNKKLLNSRLVRSVTFVQRSVRVSTLLVSSIKVLLEILVSFRKFSLFLPNSLAAHSSYPFHARSEQSCGNGIVEEGEECDPGSASSSCCDASTCRFVSGAVCDPLNSLCCTTQCQVAGSGTVCRASLDQKCDKEEVCDGSSSSCPDDSYESNGRFPTLYSLQV